MCTPWPHYCPEQVGSVKGHFLEKDESRRSLWPSTSIINVNPLIPAFVYHQKNKKTISMKSVQCASIIQRK